VVTRAQSQHHCPHLNTWVHSDPSVHLSPPYHLLRASEQPQQPQHGQQQSEPEHGLSQHRRVRHGRGRGQNSVCQRPPDGHQAPRAVSAVQSLWGLRGFLIKSDQQERKDGLARGICDLCQPSLCRGGQAGSPARSEVRSRPAPDDPLGVC